MAWFIECAPAKDRLLRWQRLRINGFETEYPEAERQAADHAAKILSQLFGDRLMFRVVHKNPRRGAFYPAPRPAKANR